MLVSEYSESEVGGVRNIDAVGMAEVAIGIDGPEGFWFLQMSQVYWVRGECTEDVLMKWFSVHKDSCAECGFKKFQCAE